MAGSYKDLIAWKKGVELVKLVYQVTAKFPKEEIYGLTSQMRRAAVSVPCNIAEGQARFSNQEFRHFLRTTKGSLAELETQAVIALDLGFMSPDDKSDLVAFILTEQRIVSGLLAKIDGSTK